MVWFHHATKIRCSVCEVDGPTLSDIPSHLDLTWCVSVWNKSTVLLAACAFGPLVLVSRLQRLTPVPMDLVDVRHEHVRWLRKRAAQATAAQLECASFDAAMPPQRALCAIQYYSSTHNQSTIDVFVNARLAGTTLPSSAHTSHLTWLGSLQLGCVHMQPVSVPKPKSASDNTIFSDQQGKKQAWAGISYQCCNIQLMNCMSISKTYSGTTVDSM